jgi:NADPH2:quinone reductase
MIAVQAAKAQGAAYVIAADRDAGRLKLARERGADVVVTLAPGADLPAAFREAAGEHGIDVIVDPLWGEPAIAAMQAASHGARYVQLGNSAASTVELPAALVRSRALHLLGFAVFHVPLEPRRQAYRDLTEQAARGLITVDTIPLPLSDVAKAWEQQKRGAHGKLVLIP